MVSAQQADYYAAFCPAVLASTFHNAPPPSLPPLPPPLPSPPSLAVAMHEALLIEALSRLEHLAACYRFHSTQLNLLHEAAPTVNNAQSFLFCQSSLQNALPVHCDS